VLSTQNYVFYIIYDFILSRYICHFLKYQPNLLGKYFRKFVPTFTKITKISKPEFYIQICIESIVVLFSNVPSLQFFLFVVHTIIFSELTRLKFFFTKFLTFPNKKGWLTHTTNFKKGKNSHFLRHHTSQSQLM